MKNQGFIFCSERWQRSSGVEQSTENARVIGAIPVVATISPVGRVVMQRTANPCR